MRYILILIAVIVVIAGGVYILSGGQSSRGVTASTGERSSSSVQSEKLPVLTLKDYDGKDVSLASFSGKPAIVNSWAAWCPFCRQELPDFASLQKEFPGIAIIAVDRAESLATAKQYSDQLGVTGTITLLLDPSDSFYKAIGGFSMPETIFVDETGTVVLHKRGPLSLSEMREVVTTLKLAQ